MKLLLPCCAIYILKGHSVLLGMPGPGAFELLRNSHLLCPLCAFSACPIRIVKLVKRVACTQNCQSCETIVYNMYKSSITQLHVVQPVYIPHHPELTLM